MSTNQPTTSTPPATPIKKPRSPIEKFLVRGGIALLLMLVAVQAHARLGYERSLQKLQTRLAAEDSSAQASPLKISELPQCIVGWPSRSIHEDRHWHLVVYKWRGLTKTFEIRMQYDSSEAEPVVMGLETADPPEEKPTPVAANTSTESAPPPMAGPGMGGMMGGPGGGGPRVDPITRDDKDGDGKVSKEEATGRLAENFDQNDTNTDGYIDADEVAARRQRFAAGRGGPPGGGEPSGRPRRPESETATETPTSEAPASETPTSEPAPDKETPAEATKPDNQ